ncbi:MAG: nitrate reductase [Gammaproteobacteria bacterium]|nr:nitrate reductase [Gammaproteobacteria bacterium]
MLFGRDKKNPIKLVDKGAVEWKYTTCGYCSTGCSIEVGLDKDGRAVSSRGVGDADVNRGKLCIKGILEHELFESAGRGRVPLLREQIHEPFRQAGWNEALDKTSNEIKRIQERYGRDAFAIVSTGQIMTEEFYTLGKLARGLIGTNNYDGNTTLCMSSAVSGYKRSFGSDGPPGCYEDFEHTDCLIAFGSNLPEQHPIIYWRMREAREQRKYPLIVVDPRVTMLAQFADMHLPIRPGTDVVLLNALAHVILKEGLHKPDYIGAHTEGFEDFKALVEQYDPVTASRICGIDEDSIRTVARLYAKAGSAMSIWTMGINQSTHGSDGVVAINNLNLITGNIGKPGGTSLSITGQCNAMGTREWSSCSGLPGYRALEKEKDRQDIAKFWGVDPEFFPKQRGLLMTDILPAIVECNEYSHVYLPAALWAEKEGCFTNTERRVNLIRNVIPPHGESKPDFWIFNEVAKRFDPERKVKFPETTEGAFEEMKQLSKGNMLDISGMTYAKIEQSRGLQWPCRDGEEKGAQRLYSDGVFQYASGKAKLIPLPFIDNNERPDTDYPFWLNSGRVVEHFHTRTRTGKIGNQNKFSPTPYMEINPDAAAELEIAHGSYARLVSRRGDAVVLVQCTQRVPRDMVFVPFHYHECVNRVSLGLLDPHSRQPAFKQCAIRIEPIADQEAAAALNLAARAY